jgi:hypothetical protein
VCEISDVAHWFRPACCSRFAKSHESNPKYDPPPLQSQQYVIPSPSSPTCQQAALKRAPLSETGMDGMITLKFNCISFEFACNYECCYVEESSNCPMMTQWMYVTLCWCRTLSDNWDGDENSFPAIYINGRQQLITWLFCQQPNTNLSYSHVWNTYISKPKHFCR